MDQEVNSVSRLRARFERIIVQNSTVQSIASPHSRKNLTRELLSISDNGTSPSRKTATNKTLSNTSSAADLNSTSSIDTNTSNIVPTEEFNGPVTDESIPLRSRMGIGTIPLNTPIIITTTTSNPIEHTQTQTQTQTQIQQIQQPISQISLQQQVQQLQQQALQNSANMNKEQVETLQKSIQLLTNEIKEVKIDNEKLRVENDQIKKDLEKERRENKNIIKRSQTIEKRLEKANGEIVKQAATVENHATAARTLRNKLDTLERKSECVVCQSREKVILFTPCNHVQCCQSCADKVVSCPVCRTVIQTKIKIFI